jgi:hypothetical protein
MFRWFKTQLRYTEKSLARSRAFRSRASGRLSFFLLLYIFISLSAPERLGTDYKIFYLLHIKDAKPFNSWLPLRKSSVREIMVFASTESKQENGQIF